MREGEGAGVRFCKFQFSTAHIDIMVRHDRVETRRQTKVVSEFFIVDNALPAVLKQMTKRIHFFLDFVLM